MRHQRWKKWRSTESSQPLTSDNDYGLPTDGRWNGFTEQSDGVIAGQIVGAAVFEPQLYAVFFRWGLIIANLFVVHVEEKDKRASLSWGSACDRYFITLLDTAPVHTNNCFMSSLMGKADHILIGILEKHVSQGWPHENGRHRDVDDRLTICIWAGLSFCKSLLTGILAILNYLIRKLIYSCYIHITHKCTVP